jgi:hypothetical protein
MCGVVMMIFEVRGEFGVVMAGGGKTIATTEDIKDLARHIEGGQ